MRDDAVTDAVLTWLPLTSGDIPDPRHAVRLGDVFVPNVRHIEVSANSLDLIVHPNARLKSLQAWHQEERRLDVQLITKHAQFFSRGSIVRYAERLGWPNAVCEVIIEVFLSEAWRREELNR